MDHKLYAQSSWKKKLYKVILPKFYGIGASVVIIGAMFKLLNWPGGSFMLGLGLSVEAIIFLFSAFEPPEKEIDWAIVYPELAGGRKTLVSTPGAIGENLATILEKAHIDAALLERLAQAFEHFPTSLEQIAALSNAAVAITQYTATVEKTTEVVQGMYQAHTGAIRHMEDISQALAAYHTQVRTIGQSLQSLNEMYKQELQDVPLRVQATQGASVHITASLDTMQAASQEAERFKTEIASLNEKLVSLNTIYSQMLAAFKH